MLSASSPTIRRRVTPNAEPDRCGKVRGTYTSPQRSAQTDKLISASTAGVFKIAGEESRICFDDPLDYRTRSFQFLVCGLRQGNDRIAPRPTVDGLPLMRSGWLDDFLQSTTFPLYHHQQQIESTTSLTVAAGSVDGANESSRQSLRTSHNQIPPE